ncbi:hypothetical protein DMH04_41325 [Kibdelosporangium aridum]|uniref:Uncharacterized protein n=1 Tax=Kibdelosporangium aridum TaxID=2030 RepID=A0A428YUS3_KIBAR|nr:hypothetical protein [Kibdelosporangium aridum]RSM73456.1 hypothetical protein DMH04_41325 [Kibdelosporangium aridum]
MSFPTLAVVADLEAYLKRSLDAAETNQAQLMLAAASAVIREETGQVFSRATSTFKLVINPYDEWVTLPQQPVISVASVLLNGSALTDWTAVNGRIYRACGWFPLNTGAILTPPPTLTITCTHGYATVPDDAKLATVLLVNAAMNGDVPVRSEQIGDYSITYADIEPGSHLGLTVEALKARYRVGRSSTVGVGNSWR